jgi:hypothetical protein
MKVYPGGLYNSGVATPQGSRSINKRVTKSIRFLHVFESFHYADDRMARMIRHNGQKLFLDSGAYSAQTLGVRISSRQYARFIREHRDIIEVASNLDVIGKGNEQNSYENLKTLQLLLHRDGLSHLIKPVHHVRDADYWLERYLDEGHDFICLGGMVPESTRILQRWLDHVWSKFLTNPDGTPKVEVHGFGLTTRELMLRYPWASVDSTTWILISRFGGVLMDFRFDDGSIGDHNISFSDRSPKRFDPNSRHYGALPPDDKTRVEHRLEQLEAERIRDPEIEAAFEAEFGVKMGFNPEALGKSYGLRDLCNIAYFERISKRGVDKFVRERRFSSSAEETHLIGVRS